MLKCDGFIMLHGRGHLRVDNNPEWTLTGTWFYRRDYDMWYFQEPGEFAQSIDPENVVSFDDDDPDPEWEAWSHGMRRRK